MATKPQNLMTVVQAADMLRITPRSVLGRIKRGTLPAIKLGPGTSAYVLTRADVERAAERQARRDASAS